MSSRAIWASRAITPDSVLERVSVRIEDGRIVSVHPAERPRADETAFEDATLVPGLVDLQVNGGSGGAYASRDPEDRRRATAFHLRSGTTSLLATVPSAPVPELERALARLAAEASEDGPIVGIHLEGPFLATAKAGAHDVRSLRDPDPATLARLLRAAAGALRMVTLAPEREGALEAIAQLAAEEVVVSAGHSLATLERLRAAVDRGLRFMTHVGNAAEWPSRSVDPRLGYRASEPGMVGTFLIERRLRGSLILDGRHLHPELAGAIVRLRGERDVALVSDATHAAGMPPGHYRAGGLDLVVHAGGYATCGEGLAGSVAPLIEGVRVAVREAGLSLEQAVRMATLTPAEVLGIAQRKGRLCAGADADLLILGPDLAIRAVYRGGAPVGPEAP